MTRRNRSPTLLARALIDACGGVDAAGTISFRAVRLARLLVGIAVRYKGRLEPPAEWLARELNVPMNSVHAWKVS